MSAGLAQRLSAAADALQDERVPLSTLASAHGTAAQGSLLVLLSLPCVLPVAGVGSVLGFGLLALAWAMVQGDGCTRLPARVACVCVSRHAAQRILRRLSQIYGRAECLARQRFEAVFARPLRVWLGIQAAVMAAVIILPLPFGNVLPAISLVFLGLALVFQDGLGVVVSIVFAGLTLAYTALLGWLVWAHGTDALTRLMAFQWPV